jgi:N-acyl-D-amino-acid deacylase
LTDRGGLREGMKADLVLFDPETIIDCGTFEDPKQTPKGIVRVYVNGALTALNGEPTGTCAGRVLRRWN